MVIVSKVCAPLSSHMYLNALFSIDSIHFQSDVIFTSFCGTSWLDASESCSIDTYCPSGVHADCPGDDQYCWAATDCNVHEFWPSPTPEPSKSPSVKNPPSDAPSGAPSVDPTGLPTHSPLPEDDPRNFMYCGTDYVSVYVSLSFPPFFNQRAQDVSILRSG